jgi:hypothetical protein
MPYAILRFQKKKSGGVSACYAHNERKKEAYKSNPHINPQMKADNYHLVLPKQTYRREVQRMIQAAGCKTRSNSTVMVETLITASPEFMAALPPSVQREYFEMALRFISSKVGGESIIAAVVHMDEKTPHMHLSFCPVTEGKNGKTLSAKAILGNQAQLSRWQTEYHAHMASRWPELERGSSSIDTKRRHIPQSLFKQAERLDKQFAEIAEALDGITHFNAPKKREAALAAFERVMPWAARFSAKVKQYDGYIKELEQAEKETRERIQAAESKGDERVRCVQGTMQRQLDSKDYELAEKEKAILAARREAFDAADKLRRQADNIDHVIGRLPLEMRTRFYEECEKVAAINAHKAKSGRGMRHGNDNR